MNEVATIDRGAGISAVLAEKALLTGDLSGLTTEERLEYYAATCKSLGLNPLTRPFDYINLDGKLVLYAKRDCTDQLRSIRNISVTIKNKEIADGVYVVVAVATTPDGRTDESIGAVSIVKESGDWKTSQSGKKYFVWDGKLLNLSPDARANAMMKAETKAKRRVTLSICGLGMSDESEVETIQARSEAPAEIRQSPNPALQPHENPLSRAASELRRAARQQQQAGAQPEPAGQPKAAEQEPVPAEVLGIWERMAKHKNIGQELGNLVEALIAVTNEEEATVEFNRILQANYKTENWQKLKLDQAKQFALELWTAVRAAEAAKQRPEPALFDDAPLPG